MTDIPAEERHANGRKIRKEALPEYHDYEDAGCDLAPSCWVLFDTIADGSWGAMGGPISLLEPGRFTEPQAADARRTLER